MQSDNTFYQPTDAEEREWAMQNILSKTKDFSLDFLNKFDIIELNKILERLE